MTAVQTFWFGSTLPYLQRLSIASFLASGHEYHLYSFDEIEGVPKDVTLCDAATILPRESVFTYQNGFGKGSYSAFSNLFRYKLILERGGWWVDTDLVCLRPFDFESAYVLGTEYETDFTVQSSTSAFRCPAGAPLLRYCAEVVEQKDKQTLQWGEIGPCLFNSAVQQFGLTGHQVPVHVFSPVNYFEFRKLLAPRFDRSLIGESYAVHLWNQMWKSENVDPEGDAPRDSLLGILKERFL